MSFKEIIGQDHAISFLKKAYRQNRLAHAYIFAGPEGIGKMKTALDFAKLLVCVHVEDAEACRVCASCLKADSFNHPDIQHVVPDGAFIKIDDIREACRRLSLKSFESSKKVLLINSAQRLNEESSNALLKTLEEPSKDTVIILIADTLKTIAPTIVSRCQRVAFSLLPQSALQSVLKERFNIGDTEALFLARASDGSLGVALKYHEDKLFTRKSALIKNVLDKNCSFETFLVSAGKERSEKLEKVFEALGVVSMWLRDLLVAQVTRDTRNLINVDAKDDIMLHARDFTFDEIEDRLSAIAATQRDLERNANVRISLARLRAELWK